MRPVTLASAAHATGGKGDAPDDANRLRRMDRFGRAGYLAGTRAFAAAGLVREAGPDARSGVVVGTRHGCRSAITGHAALLVSAARLEDLLPSVFAATVHNTVNGELAIALGFGGISETIVSGRAAGLEALILGARRVAAGNADRILVVAAEGVDDAMREAWEEERHALGESAAGVDLVETGAAVLLEAREITSNGEEGRRERIRFLDGCVFFEPDARRAAARFFEWAYDVAAAKPAVALCTPDYEGFFEGREDERNETTRVERFGAAGVFEIARDVVRIAKNASFPFSPSKKIRLYVTRDITGAVAAVALESFT